MIRRLFHTLAVLAILSSCGVLRKSPDMNGQISEWTVSGVEFDNGDFSGLCFSRDGRKMVASFNSAALYWLDIPVAGRELHFTPLQVNGADFRISPRDCECVTLDRTTGDIYYGQERSSDKFRGASIYRIKAPRYDEEELVLTFDEDVMTDGNRGLEGLTWIGGDNFIACREGNWSKREKRQTLDPLLIFYSLRSGITEIVVPPAEIKQIAEIVYDDVRKCLWILDGDYEKQIYRCDMHGQILDRFPIPYIKNAEALLLDRKRSCIWIGSDETPSKLYRIGFNNL